MDKIKEETKQLYEDLRGILYRINHLHDSFNNNFFARTEIEKNIKAIVTKNLKTILADCYLTLENLSTILSANDESELIEVIGLIKDKILISG